MKRDLGALTGREHDLLVVGGGIYGVAAAWDAAQRGLAVGLVEAHDFGSGTSWNSLKTIHGGLRHVQRAELGLVRESVHERRALLRIAPDLVRPLPFLVPAYGHGRRGIEALAVGLLLSDLVGHDRNRGLPPDRHIPSGRILSRREVLDLAPGVAAPGLTGGALWTDAQVSSSERLILGFLHAAASAGAVIANRVEAAAFLRSGSAVKGVRAREVLGGAEIDVRARLVLNAAGPGMDGLLRLARISRPPVPLLCAMNLVLARSFVTRCALGAVSGGRYLFMVPWRDRTIVGTAYAPADDPRKGDGVDAFREEVGRAYPWAGIERADVTLVHRGLVPGRSADALWTRPLLLDHERIDGVPGLVSLQGVKYTTARGVAERAVDLVVKRLGLPASPCRTAVTPLPGARALDGPLEERTRRAVHEEMALGLGDAVLRRLDLGTAGPPQEADLEAVTRTMASELGWTEDRVRTERQALAEVYATPFGQPG